ncbi:MAG: tetratricopeptide repeat protein [Elusimicrobia bacterium]|nr:tetratricopeptide repeat protein [Elusimicrobiota bacterium]
MKTFWFVPAAVVLILLVNAWAGHLKPERFPEELPKAFAATRGYVGGSRDLVLVGLGLRRMAADFAMMDMLIYYGTYEETPEQGHDISDAGWVRGRDPDSLMYQDILPLTKRVIGLDPFFRYAVLYGAGVLAFNEGRYAQAVELLNEALKRDPQYWPYNLNLSAIAYKKAGDFPKVVSFLEQIYPLPECPTMLKNILANIYLKIGRKAKAVEIFKWMAQSAPEAEYREIAKERLKKLRV